MTQIGPQIQTDRSGHNCIALPRFQYRVVQTLRTVGSLSRTELAEYLECFRALISSTVKDLVYRALIEESETTISTGSHRARMLCFNTNFGYVIGSDTGAVSADCTIADFDGLHLVRHAEAIDVSNNPQQVLAQVLETMLA